MPCSLLSTSGSQQIQAKFVIPELCREDIPLFWLYSMSTPTTTRISKYFRRCNPLQGLSIPSLSANAPCECPLSPSRACPESRHCSHRKAHQRNEQIIPHRMVSFYLFVSCRQLFRPSACMRSLLPEVVRLLRYV